MPIEQLEELRQGLVNVVQQAMQSGEILSEELLIEIASTLKNLTDQIEASKGEAPNEIPQLEQGPFPSSNINAFKYDPKNQRLFVKFHGKDSADSGPTYGYSNVPKYIYDVFASGSVAPKTSGRNKFHQWIKGVTPSLGASMNALIKAGKYAYQRLA